MAPSTFIAPLLALHLVVPAAAALAAPLPLQGDAADHQPAWFEGDYNEAIATCRSSEQPLLLAFLPTWSDYSNKLRDETLVDPDVRAELCGMLLLEVDVDDPRGAQVGKLHGVSNFPMLLVLDATGRAEDRIEGFIPAGPLVGELKRIAAGQNTVSDFRARYEADPEDGTLRLALADKLYAVGSAREADRHVRALRREDPEGNTRAGAVVRLREALQAMVDAAGPAGPPAFDLAPVQQVLAELGDDRTRYEGQLQVAQVATAAGKPEVALAATRAAWEALPDDQVTAWGNELVFNFVEGLDELDEPTRALWLEIAEEVARRAEAEHAAMTAGEAPTPADGTSPDAWLATRLDGLAWACFGAGQRARARELAARCAELDPDNEEYPGRPVIFADDA